MKSQITKPIEGMKIMKCKKITSKFEKEIKIINAITIKLDEGSNG